MRSLFINTNSFIVPSFVFVVERSKYIRYVSMVAAKTSLVSKVIKIKKLLHEHGLINSWTESAHCYAYSHVTNLSP